MAFYWGPQSPLTGSIVTVSVVGRIVRLVSSDMGPEGRSIDVGPGTSVVALVGYSVWWATAATVRLLLNWGVSAARGIRIRVLGYPRELFATRSTRGRWASYSDSVCRDGWYWCARSHRGNREPEG